MSGARDIWDPVPDPPAPNRDLLEELRDRLQAVVRRLEQLSTRLDRLTELVEATHGRGHEGPPLPPQGDHRERRYQEGWQKRNEELQEYLDHERRNAASSEEAQAIRRSYFEKKGGD